MVTVGATVGVNNSMVALIPQRIVTKRKLIFKSMMGLVALEGCGEMITGQRHVEGSTADGGRRCRRG